MEIEFRQEFGAWERAGGKRAGRSLKELGKIGMKRSQEIYDAFLNKALAEYNDKLKLNFDQIEIIRNAYLYLDYPYYKNLPALMFSYYCLDMKGNINKKNLNYIKNNLISKRTKIVSDEEEEKEDKKGFVALEDVIRYCRMWKENKRLFKYFQENFTRKSNTDDEIED